MLSMFDSPVYETLQAREHQWQRFVHALQNIYGYPLPFHSSDLVCLHQAFSSGAFGLPESYACALAFYRKQSCPELRALKDIIFMRDEWYVPLEHYNNSTFKAFWLWLEKIQSTTKSPSAVLVFND